MKKLQRLFRKLITLLIYRNDTQLMTYPGKKDRDWFIKQTIYGTLFGTLTGGVFLTGLFIEMNTSDSIMGYLPNIGSIAGIMVIFAGIIIEKLKSRRKYIVVMNIIAKTLIAGVVWLPRILPADIAPYAMIACVFIGYSVNAFMGLAINSLFIDVVDEKIRGRYMGVKQIFALIVTAIVPVVLGRFVDISGDKYLTFCIFYTVAWFLMWAETHSFAKITDPEFKHLDQKKIRLKDMIVIPIRNKEFMKMMGTFVVFYFAWFISMSFASVYQIKYLELPYVFIAGAATFNAVLQMFLYPLWGKFIDKYGAELTRNIAIGMYMIHALLYIFFTRENAYVWLVLLNLNAAIMGPAWMLGVFNTKYSIIPAEGRTIYDGFFTSVIGVIIVAAPAVGNLIRSFILKSNITFLSFPQFRLMFALTFALLVIQMIFIIIRSKKKNNMEMERLLIHSIKNRKRRKKA
ncbi:MAG: MFS transporter [Clostridia bacterium]|nr:MFS transporter [Clostridia bacterium]